MLSKILDEFDIDSYGWFSSKLSDFDITRNEITEQCKKTWSMWITQPTQVYFQTSDVCARSLGATIESLHKIFKKPLTHTTQVELANKFIDYHSKNLDPAYIFGDVELPTTQPSCTYISIPGSFLGGPMLEANDPFQLADAITGYGLEALEQHRQALLHLSHPGLQLLHQLHTQSKLDPPTPQDPTPHLAVVASCTLDIWYATVMQRTRSHILSKWPGWTEFFEARDQLLSTPPEEVQNAIARKSKFTSDLRRFCMALAFNLMARGPNHYVTFPRTLFRALPFARNHWKTHVKDTPLTDGQQLLAISSFVNQLSDHLSSKEWKPRKQSSKPRTGSGMPTNPMSLPDFLSPKDASRRTSFSSTIELNPTSPTTAKTTPPLKQGELTIPPPAFVYPRSLKTRPPLDANLNSLSLHRKPIANQVSAASWFVKGPPPSDPGQLQGMLDEGSLLKYAAFSDPSIFMTPPEVGYGHIAMCVLVDASNSMGAGMEGIGHRTRFTEALAFIAGLRDGLSSSPHVSLFSYAFDGVSTNEYNMYNPPPDALANRTNQDRICHVCRLRPIENDYDYETLLPKGSTPAGTAIFHAHNLLASQYPDSSRVILILTDGEPCGTLDDTDNENWYYEDESAVRRLIESIDTPVFAVGFGGVRAKTLEDQYNPGKFFVVNNPVDTVDVACNLISSIGKSFNT